jgi:hypothetical protein
MDKAIITEKIAQIESKRQFLVDLLDRPNLGSLRIDVNQALEELDELVADFKQTFADEKPQN